jgi:hypothetical protein
VIRTTLFMKRLLSVRGYRLWATTASPYGSRFAFSTNYGTPSIVKATHF